MKDVQNIKPQKFPLFIKPKSQTPHENVFTYSEKPSSPKTLFPLWNMAPVTLNSSIKYNNKEIYDRSYFGFLSFSN